MVFLLWGFSLGIFQGYPELDVFVMVNFNFQWQVKKKGVMSSIFGGYHCYQGNVFNNGTEWNQASIMEWRYSIMEWNEIKVMSFVLEWNRMEVLPFEFQTLILNTRVIYSTNKNELGVHKKT